MLALYLSVEGTVLTAKTTEQLTTGGHSQFEASVAVSDEWEGMALTVFFNGCPMPVFDGNVRIPDSELETKRLAIYVIGMRGNTLYTSTLSEVVLKDGDDGWFEVVDDEVSPEKWQEYIILINQKINEMNSSIADMKDVREDVDLASSWIDENQFGIEVPVVKLELLKDLTTDSSAEDIIECFVDSANLQQLEGAIAVNGLVNGLYEDGDNEFRIPLEYSYEQLTSESASILNLWVAFQLDNYHYKVSIGLSGADYMESFVSGVLKTYLDTAEDLKEYVDKKMPVIASEKEVEQGENNSKYITPMTLKDAIDGARTKSVILNGTAYKPVNGNIDLGDIKETEQKVLLLEDILSHTSSMTTDEVLEALDSSELVPLFAIIIGIADFSDIPDGLIQADITITRTTNFFAHGVYTLELYSSNKAPYRWYWANGEWLEYGTNVEDGATFTPIQTVVNNTLELSWENDKGLDNPDPVSIIAPKGEKGADGVDGTNGTDGQDGANGLSAYEVAVENGYEGTEAEWLVSLKGATGATGDTGATGATGAQGVKGVQGVQGETGEQGVQGVAGADGSVFIQAENETDAINLSESDTFNMYWWI